MTATVEDLKHEIAHKVCGSAPRLGAAFSKMDSSRQGRLGLNDFSVALRGIGVAATAEQCKMLCDNPCATDASALGGDAENNASVDYVKFVRDIGSTLQNVVESGHEASAPPSRKAGSHRKSFVLSDGNTPHQQLSAAHSAAGPSEEYEGAQCPQ